MSPHSTTALRRTRTRRRHSRALVTLTALGNVTLLLVALYVVSIRSGTTVEALPTALTVTTVTVEAPYEITLNNSYVDNTYSFGAFLKVKGPGEVRLISARATKLSPGLTQPEAILGNGCDGRETWGTAVGADLSRKPRTEVHALGARSLRASDGDCWYLLLRFVPHRKGPLRAAGGDVVYRTGGVTVRRTFTFEITLDVRHVGRDPREKPDVR